LSKGENNEYLDEKYFAGADAWKFSCTGASLGQGRLSQNP
jgi:hypothetical protein